MKKAELEAKVLKLEQELILLRNSIQTYQPCHCYHYIPCNLPHYPTTPYWTTITSGSNGNVTFGNIS